MSLPVSCRLVQVNAVVTRAVTCLCCRQHRNPHQCRQILYWQLLLFCITAKPPFYTAGTLPTCQGLCEVPSWSTI